MCVVFGHRINIFKILAGRTLRDVVHAQPDSAQHEPLAIIITRHHMTGGPSLASVCSEKPDDGYAQCLLLGTVAAPTFCPAFALYAGYH